MPCDWTLCEKEALMVMVERFWDNVMLLPAVRMTDPVDPFRAKGVAMSPIDWERDESYSVTD